jgi:pyruvate-ferredoxin/flavodoxin oxidoreductase
VQPVRDGVPHAAIRPALVTEEEGRGAGGFETKKPWARSSRTTSSACRCLPRTAWAAATVRTSARRSSRPGDAPLETQLDTQVPNQRYFSSLPVRDDVAKRATVKGSQFVQPLLEFSGACAGCGETPYAKLITQLFGERMVIGNATGCSSIWGGSAPAIPYCVDKDGSRPHVGQLAVRGPGEFTYGMLLGQMQQRANWPSWPSGRGDGHRRRGEGGAFGVAGQHEGCRGIRKYGDQLKALLPNFSDNALLAEINAMSGLFTKKSYWVFLGRRRGLRHRLRRHGPRAGFRRGYQRHGLRHGGVLQHRRPELQGNAHGLHRQVRRPAKRPPKRTWAPWP